VGAAASKSVLLGLIILATARLFATFEVPHPLWMLAFLILTSVTFSLFGFIIGIWADGFEKRQLVPLLIVTPLTFLGGSFYSIDMLPPVWRTITLANPVVYRQRVPLELLWELRCERWRKPLHDHGLPDPVLGDSVVDLQDRIPAQSLIDALLAQRPALN
jgi:ABC-2 type transporter